jgi:hypothetical protein
VRARDHLHERALAGAVLADKRVDLARLNREIDAGERDRRAERLSDAAHHQAIAGGRISHRSQQ